MSDYENTFNDSDAQKINIIQINNTRSVLQYQISEKPSPARIMIEVNEDIEIDGENGLKHISFTDQSNNYWVVSAAGHNHDHLYYKKTEIDADFANYYTKTNLQTSGESEIHRGNLIGYENPFYLNEFVRIRADGRHYYLEIKGVDEVWHTKQHFWQD